MNFKCPGLNLLELWYKIPQKVFKMILDTDFFVRGAGYGSHTDTNLGSDFRNPFGYRLAVMLTA